MTLKSAEEQFRETPSNKTAAAYLRELMRCEGNDMIEQDTFLDGLVSIQLYLEGKQ